MDTSKQPDSHTIFDSMENIRQWVISSEGQTAIAANLKRAHVLAAQFREAERVAPEKLRKPFTL